MSANTEITGTAHAILPLQTFPSGFSKQVLVINTGGQYPQYVPIEFTKDRTKLLEGIATGQEVTAQVDIRGNEYQGKYYASLNGWKLEAGEKTAHSQKRQQNDPPPREDPADEYDEDDDVPF